MVNKFKLNTSKNSEIKESINRTLEIVNNYAGELSIEVLSLDKIELDPDNNRELALTLHDAINGIDATDPEYERKKKDWKSLESLSNTIRVDQLINPIFVYRYGNKCRLIAGERRTLASAIAGKKEIIARISNQRPIGTKLKVLQWIENNERVELKLKERITSLESIIKEYLSENGKSENNKGVTSKVLSDLTGMSNTQSNRYNLILRSEPEIKQAIMEGKLENIKLIELICSVESIEHKKELLNAALSGLTFDAIIKLKKALEENYMKNKEIKRGKKRGVNLGKVKPNVVKIIVETLSASVALNEEIVRQMITISSNTEWGDCESAEKIFRKIIALLEKGYKEI